jgi:hypothetical protein
MSASFTATEYTVTEHAIAETGCVEWYSADTIDEAVRKCLYTKQLSNGKAFVGPTGRVVHCGEHQWCVMRAK